MALNGSRYQGNLQERLRILSIRTNCPTRQENGQRYLGPPVDWAAKPPTNAEVFLSKLPADCYEDEIYDFCAQAGQIYLIRLMINFENENRGFCFVTYSNAKEAATAVAILPQKSLRKGLHIHAEISLNNCTLKMYGLDFRWKDEDLEQEIRANTKDVVNVTIKRNMSQRSLMATLYFDTHQKAAIARRKLSQIANSRWGQNIKVFLWSKKLQNKNLHKQDYEVGRELRHKSDKVENHISGHTIAPCVDVNSYQMGHFRNFNKYTSTMNLLSTASNSWLKSYNSIADNAADLSDSDYFIDDFLGNSSHDLNNNLSPKYEAAESADPFTLSGPNLTGDFQRSPSTSSPGGRAMSAFLSSSESLPRHSKTSLCDMDPYSNWNTDMFPKPKTPILDLCSPFDCSPESCVYASETSFQDRQIEVILQEALEALARGGLKESCE